MSVVHGERLMSDDDWHVYCTGTSLLLLLLMMMMMTLMMRVMHCSLLTE